MCARMLNLDTNFFEIILRAVLIYSGLFIMFRIVGKKQLGEMSPFDFVLVLIISESVSNALGSGENSVTGGLISAATLMLLSYFMDFLTYKFKKFEKIADGEARILIRDGQIIKEVFASEKITKSEMEEALRGLKIESIDDVRIAFIEANGKVSAFKK